jgi:hypothetical protein
VPFTSAHVVMMVYDVMKKHTFDRLPHILAETRTSLDLVGAGGAALLVLGNLTVPSGQERQVPYKDAKRFANERGLIYLEANVGDISSVDVAFARLAVECLNFSMLDPNRLGRHREKASCAIQ